jgi:hypothetical protein
MLIGRNIKECDKMGKACLYVMGGTKIGLKENSPMMSFVMTMMNIRLPLQGVGVYFLVAGINAIQGKFRKPTKQLFQFTLSLRTRET